LELARALFRSGRHSGVMASLKKAIDRRSRHSRKLSTRRAAHTRKHIFDWATRRLATAIFTTPRTLKEAAAGDLDVELTQAPTSADSGKNAKVM